MAHYVYALCGNCGYDAWGCREDPYVVTFGVFSTLEAASEHARQVRGDPRLGYHDSPELSPLYVHRYKLNAPGDRIFIRIETSPDS